MMEWKVLQEETQFRAGIRVRIDSDGETALQEKRYGGDWLYPDLDDASAMQAYFYDVVVAGFKAGVACALDPRLEVEADEWVEVEVDGWCKRRFSPDGSKFQYLSEDHGWLDDIPGALWTAVLRKALSIRVKPDAELREELRGQAEAAREALDGIPARERVVDWLGRLELAASDEDETTDWEEAHATALWLLDTDARLRQALTTIGGTDV